jgi:pimeloyl-ACP methyl ester carboxylesterase
MRIPHKELSAFLTRHKSAIRAIPDDRASGPRAAGPDTREAPWSFAAPWGGRGWVTDLAGPVHWIEFGSADLADTRPVAEAAANAAPASATADVLSTSRPADPPPIVFVHGLGGSHLDWVRVGSGLAVDRRAIALDLRGFGLTPGRPRQSTVAANVALLDRFLREVVGRPAVLVGNSMGGLISILQSHAHPETVAGLVLVNPALPQPGPRPELRVVALFLAYALPGLGEICVRAEQRLIPAEDRVRGSLGYCFANPFRAPRELVSALVALTEERRRIPGTAAPFVAAARSTVPAVMDRRNRAALGAIRVPVLLIHGEADRLVSVLSSQAAAAANPGWETRFLPDVGHMPQLEMPEPVLDAVTGWLARHPALHGRQGVSS